MAIADTITSMQNHTSNAYTMIGYGTDLTGINKNLANLKQCIFDALINSMSDTLNPTWNNLPKISTTPGTSQSINNTIEAPMRIELGASELTQAGTPTPSSPQDIHTISGSNTIKVEGNLFDISTISESKYLGWSGEEVSTANSNSSDYIEVKANQSYKLTWNYTEPLNSSAQREIVFYNTSKAFVNTITLMAMSNKTKTFTAPNDGYIRFDYDKKCYDIMLNKGNTALPYTPYTLQEADIDLGDIEYCKIGDYSDRIFKNVEGDPDYDDTNLEVGLWYLKKNIGKVVLDGTANWTENKDKTYVKQYVKNGALDSNMVNGTSNIMSDYFKYKQGDPTDETNEDYIWVYGTQLVLDMRKSIVADNTELKAWMGTNQPTFYFPLATPTYTQITGTLAEQLEYVYQKMLSQKGQTNISQVNDDLSFNLSVQAIEELS